MCTAANAICSIRIDWFGIVKSSEAMCARICMVYRFLLAQPHAHHVNIYSVSHFLKKEQENILPEWIRYIKAFKHSICFSVFFTSRHVWKIPIQLLMQNTLNIYMIKIYDCSLCAWTIKMYTYSNTQLNTWWKMLLMCTSYRLRNLMNCERYKMEQSIWCKYIVLCEYIAKMFKVTRKNPTMK